MRVAAIYDIHGNLPALEAVVNDIRRAGVDSIVAGGDVILGPMSSEALAYLLAIDIPIQFILGNCEVAVLDILAGKEPSVPKQVLELVRWTSGQISPEQKKIISGWDKTLQLYIEDLGEVMFCHATPRNENEIFTRLTPEENLIPVFEGLKADSIVCGHTHMQFDRMIGRKRVINAGSVGMPFGKTGADWLLLGPDIQLRHTSYNLQQASGRIQETGYPQAKEFVEQCVLNFPSEKIILEAYSRVEIGASKK